MGQGGETKVTVVLDPRALEALGLGDGRPDLCQVLDQSGSEVAQGVVPRWSRMTKKRRDLGVDLGNVRGGTCMHHTASSLLLVLEEELQVDLEDSLEQPHVGSLVQADLMLPDVEDQDLAGG